MWCSHINLYEVYGIRPYVTYRERIMQDPDFSQHSNIALICGAARGLDLRGEKGVISCPFT